MACVWQIIPLLLATLVLADYYIDNANASVTYSMPASQSGQSWQTFSTGTQSLALQFTNSTGTYNVTLDSSHCYDENYALGVCGTIDNCFVQMPFTGSGITIYVFSAGFSGMAAGFSVDGDATVSETIQAPLPPTYQVSNVSLYDIQGLPSGNHTLRMTLLDWNGTTTSMKFDYAYVNETFVAPATTPTSTSSVTSSPISQIFTQTPTQAPTQTPTEDLPTSNKVNLGGIVGGTLGGIAIIGGVIICFFYFRKRKAQRQEESVDPFRSEYLNSPTPAPVPYASQRPFFARHPDATRPVSPLQRSAILRDALAASNYLSGSVRGSPSVSSGSGLPSLQPLRRQASHNADTDLHAHSSATCAADAGSPFLDPPITPQYNLTAEQLEVIYQLRAEKVPAETIARVIEGFVSSRVPSSETSSEQITCDRSTSSGLPPPSYQTQAR